MRSNRIGAFFFGAVSIALVASGCYAHESAYVRADVAPVHVETYPRTHYEGRVVYLVDDRWYVRDRGHWVYYRVEPEPLYRYRVHVQRAPRAQEPRHHHHHHHADDHHRDGRHYRESLPGYVAPPARRVD